MGVEVPPRPPGYRTLLRSRAAWRIPGSTGPPPYDRQVSDLPPRIGTLREKPLHASLKQWYALPGDRVECPVDGFVIDLVRGDLLIEIQTSGFSSMKQKVVSLLDTGYQVRIVHPIPVDRWIVKVDEDGTILSRRRSPRHGAPTDVFSELVSFPESMAHPGFEVEVVMTIEEQYRAHTPGRAWRRKGWTVLERRLVDVADTFRLTDIDDLTGLLPSGLPDEFTTADLAERLRRPKRTAQQIAYCLRILGAVTVVGKVGNTFRYQLR